MGNLIENLIKYQNIDSKLKEIEDAMHQEEAYKKYAEAYKYLSECDVNFESLEKSAIAATNEYNYLINEVKKNKEDLLRLQGELSRENENFVDILNELQAINDELALKTKQIDEISNKIKSIYKSFGTSYVKYKEMNTQLHDYKEKYDAVKAKYDPKRAEIKKQLMIIEGLIDNPIIMVKYKDKRKNKKFPIVYQVDLSLNRCPVCQTGFSLSFSEDLKNGKVKECECEYCHRLLCKK